MSDRRSGVSYTPSSSSRSSSSPFTYVSETSIRVTDDDTGRYTTYSHEYLRYRGHGRSVNFGQGSETGSAASRRLLPEAARSVRDGGGSVLSIAESGYGMSAYEDPPRSVRGGSSVFSASSTARGNPVHGEPSRSVYWGRDHAAAAALPRSAHHPSASPGSAYSRAISHGGGGGSRHSRSDSRVGGDRIRTHPPDHSHGHPLDRALLMPPPRSRVAASMVKPEDSISQVSSRTARSHRSHRKH
ncbi:hypothetical protein F4808DRAFT_52940 [Astrocystis sublimbata]|nr:hypothetical protein F4808DRAFT_52940 [Astrocystis sublimbata]